MIEIKNLEERVLKVLVKVLGKEAEGATNSCNLEEDLGADSLDAVEIIMDLEDEFNVEINEASLQGMATVQAIHDYLATAKISTLKKIGT